MEGDKPAAQGLAELVAARLCHDMSGPLSVVSNAAEIARLEAERGGGEAGAVGSEAMTLMLEGAQAIAARVKLLRALFGPATGTFSAEDLSALSRDAIGGGRVSLDLSGLEPGTVFSPAASRAVLAALVAAGEALPGGGTVRCHGGAEDVSIAIEGTNAAWPPTLTAVLAGGDPVETALAGGSRALIGPMLVLLARDAGLRPVLLMGSGVPLLRLVQAGA